MLKKTIAILFTSVIMTIVIGIGIHFATKGDADETLAVNYDGKVVPVSAVQEEYDKFEEIYNSLPDTHKGIFNPLLPETNYQNYLHYMANQKVKSDLNKELVLLMTRERISMMIHILHVNYDSYKLSDVYADILYRWYDGDFSRIDKDHDEIWAMRRGTIEGKATGILTPEEEAAIVEYGNDKSKNKDGFYFYNTDTNK